MSAEQGRTPAGVRPETEIQPKRGLRFEHARQIVGDGAERRPAVCTITRVAQGTVYYRNETGFLSYMSVERFPTIVKHWLRRER